MQRCAHSTRVLESLTKDFAAINFREQRARHFYLHTRRFSIRPRKLHLQSASGRTPNKSPVPFESEPTGSAFAGCVHKSKDVSPETESSVTGTNRTEKGMGVLVSPATRSELLQERPVDSVCLKRLEQDERQPEDGAITPVSVLSLAPISQQMPARRASDHVVPTSVPSRRESRIQRKLRRIEQAKWKPSAQQKEGASDHEDDSTTDALRKIGSMGGPSTPHAATGTVVRPNSGKEAGKRKLSDGEDKATSHVKSRPIGKAATATSMGPAKPHKERWMVEKAALKQKFGDQGWQPRKRLSPDTLEGIRALHASDPATYSTPTLASHFQITPEAIRRILKSKWRPSAEDSVKRMERWEKRGVKKWQEMAAKGIRPPKKWKEMGVEDLNSERKRMKRGISDQAKVHSNWDAAVDAANRLPFEGSFADRIL